MIKKILFVVYFCFTCLIGFGQNLFYEHITTNYGLPSEVIYDAYSDRNGFLWFTTDIGIIRYNGEIFKSYPNQNNLSASGSLIKEDPYGRIWYHTFDGFFNYIEDNEIKTLDVPPYTYKTFAIHENFIYRIQENGLERINTFTLETELIYKSPSLIFCLNFDNSIIFGNKTLYKLHLTSGIIEEFAHIPEEIISPLVFNNDEFVVMADKTKADLPIYLVSKNAETKKGKLLLNEVIQNLKIVDDEIWIFTTNGIYRYDFNFQLKEQAKLFDQISVSSLTLDSNNFLWFGSPNNGIYLVKQLDGVAFHDKDIFFSKLTQDKHTLYAGTTDGKLFSINKELEITPYFDSKENNHILFANFSNHPKYNFFTGNGFYVLDKNNNEYRKNPISVKDIAFQNDTTLYIAATGLVSKINPNYSISTASLYQNALLLDVRAKSIDLDIANSTLYASTNKGLFKFFDQEIEKIKYNNEDVYHKKIRIKNDSLFCLNYEGKIDVFSTNKWTSVEDIGSIQDIKKIEDELYFRTKHGIYTLKGNRFLKAIELSKFHQIIDFEKIDENFYIQLKNKIIKIPSVKKRIEKNKPKIFIDGVYINETKQDSFKEQINVSHHENQVGINFSWINFGYTTDYKLMYYLNGIPNEINWLQENILLPNLAYGLNTIQFSIQDNQTKTSIYNSEGIQINVNLPFWKSYWFYLGFAFCIIILLFISYKLQLKKINKKNRLIVEKLQLEGELKESKLQLIKSQMNPHFFFNAISNIQSYIFTKETKEASLYLTKFSKLTRKILEHSDLNQLSLQEEISSLELYLDLQKMRFNDLNYQITTTNITDTSNIYIPTMLLQPYIENAILHGLSHSDKEKKLIVTFTLQSSSRLIVIIEDNGIGRRKSEQMNAMQISKPKSFATKASLERIKLLNKDHYKIEVNYEDLLAENENSLGTRVTITISI